MFGLQQHKIFKFQMIRFELILCRCLQVLNHNQYINHWRGRLWTDPFEPYVSNGSDALTNDVALYFLLEGEGNLSIALDYVYGLAGFQEKHHWSCLGSRDQLEVRVQLLHIRVCFPQTYNLVGTIWLKIRCGKDQCIRQFLVRIVNRGYEQMISIDTEKEGVLENVEGLAYRKPLKSEA